MMIELSNVTFNYSVQEQHTVAPALQNVSLRIPEGQTVAIIGHNGSGKSTLTKLMAAILFPQAGTVQIDGLEARSEGKDLWSIRERVGVVFQNPDDQLIASTVIDDIAFGPENLGLPRSEIAVRVQEAIELLDLQGQEQMSISELSISLKQRVAIAGVLAMRPRYLILDEPTTMISGHIARQLLDTVQRLAHERAMTVLHITHFMQEIASFDRVIVMNAGCVLMDGTPEAIFARADELQHVGLDVPMVTRLGRKLSSQGWSQLADVVLTTEQLLQAVRTGSVVEAEQEERPYEYEEAQSVFKPSADATIPEQAVAQDVDAMARPVIFDLQDISYTYRSNTPFAQEALRHISFSLVSGETVGIIGPTGSGKSTLCDLFAGLIKPATGIVYFEGENTQASSFKMTRIRSHVGIVFQSPEAQIFEETVGKDVSFGPRQHKVSLAESRRRVQSSLEAVGLPYEDFRSRYTYALSGGQKRRVAIAGVLALEPKVIIFDEPMAGLDPRGRDELFAMIRALKQREGLTVIYSSSSLKDVIELVDTVHVIDKGSLLVSGTPREILHQADILDSLDIALPEAAQIALSLRQIFPSLRTDVLDLPELEAELQKAHSRVL
jgi:energy-coupling factor transporter ATPase